MFDSCNCPLAVYLIAEVPGTGFVAVGAEYISTNSSTFELPQAARFFVRSFDEGLYPELVA
jgi:hypothetical protein